MTNNPSENRSTFYWEAFVPKITPTVGRVVLFHPGAGDSIYISGQQPLAAQIACVHDDNCITLGVLDGEGNHHARKHVKLLEDGEVVVATSEYCYWMPYQLGQAAKTAEAEAKVQPEPRDPPAAGPNNPNNVHPDAQSE